MMAQVKTFHVEVSNPSDLDKVDESVVVKLKDVKKVDFSVRHASVSDNGSLIQCQLDDMDGDLENDELFFVTDIKAHETKTFEVKIAEQPLMPVYVAPKGKENRVYTALQFRDKKDRFPDLLRVEAKGTTDLFNDIYMHGVTIESELTGYRIYFDARQNIDLYGKKYRRIELPETQFYTSAEQLAQGYGVDVLWAGQAIGCGSFKRFEDGKPANWTDVALRGQRVVTQGPLRTVIEVYNLGVKGSQQNPPGIAKRTGVVAKPIAYDVHQYYTLVAGHRDLKVDIKFKNANKARFCTGVQKVGVTATDSVRRGHKPEGIIREDGIIASWGCDYPDMGKKQLWGPEPIGMAVYVPTSYVRKSSVYRDELISHEDDLNYIYELCPVDNEIHYNVTFCADKEEKGYHSAKEWFGSLDAWKKNIDNPVKIRVLKK